jgi:hypothetical protein
MHFFPAVPAAAFGAEALLDFGNLQTFSDPRRNLSLLCLIQIHSFVNAYSAGLSGGIQLKSLPSNLELLPAR